MTSRTPILLLASVAIISTVVLLVGQALDRDGDGHRAAGYESDLWTCPRVAEVIAEEFDVMYHPDHISRLLRTLGWSPQRPQRRAAERNEARIQGWIRKDWPRIKRKPRAGTPGA